MSERAFLKLVAAYLTAVTSSAIVAAVGEQVEWVRLFVSLPYWPVAFYAYRLGQRSIL